MTSDFADFHESLLNLVKTFEEKNVLLKMYSDPNSNIVRIYGEKYDSVFLAKVGLEEIEELAFTTAEHHPYWNLLYGSSQILKIVLEKWNERLTKDELNEILWYIKEIKNVVGNITNHLNE